MPVTFLDTSERTGGLRNFGFVDTLLTVAQTASLKIQYPPIKNCYSPDGELFEYFALNQNSDTTLILTHGLEGSMNSHYVKLWYQLTKAEGFNVVAWNMRGCQFQGKIKGNKLYHSGLTEDLECIASAALIDLKSTKKLVVVGFSLGANLTAKFMAERAPSLESKSGIKISGVSISSPFDLKSASLNLKIAEAKSFEWWFLKGLLNRVAAQAPQFLPEQPLSTVYEFDEYVTAPMHGYRSAKDYYDSNSSIKFLDKVTLPLLIINAENDFLLTDECMPIEQAEANALIHMYVCSHGGHCSFVDKAGKSVDFEIFKTWLEGQ